MKHDSAASELRSIRDLLRYAVTRFGEARLTFGHGSQTALDEAVYLVYSTLNLPLAELEPYLDARLLQKERAAVLRVIERRASGIPASYLTHEAWLGDYRFYVDERAIIPRSLIAWPLTEALAPFIARPLEVTDVLELCCGSASLAIIAADVFPNAQVDAVDISADALKVARRNVEDYGLSDRIHLFEADLYGAIGKKRYDLIICNPPYVNEASMQALPREYRHEPRLALAGGVDGMDVVRRVLARALTHLKRRSASALILEIGHEMENFNAAFPELEYTALSTPASDDSVLLIEARALKNLKP